MSHRKFILIVLFVFASTNLFCQKFSSKYYYTPTLLNPAFTGRFLGDYRISGVSRSEKNFLSQDITSAFSLDLRMLKSVIDTKDKLAIGFSGLSQTDSYYGLKDSHFLLSLAYFKGLDEDGIQQLGIGFQANFSTKKLQPPVYIFPSQIIAWESTGFTGVGLSQRRAIIVNYTDFNAGLSYQNFINSKHLVSVGISLLHFTYPKKRFDGAEFSLPPEVGIQLGLESQLQNTNKLLANLTVNTNSETKKIDNFSLGFIYQISIGQSLYKLNAGCFYKNDKVYGRSISPNIGLKFNNINLNILYDSNLSRNSSLQKNVFEMGMVFTGIRKNKK